MEWGPNKAKIACALKKLFKEDSSLFDVDGGECSVSFRLGHYLIDLYPTYDVDCEYNRHGQNPKYLYETGNIVRPDIIIHKRNSQDDNLLIIEAKKSKNKDTESDIKKLQEFTNIQGKFGYKTGLHIIFGPAQINDISVYENGIIDNSKTEDIKEYLNHHAIPVS